MWLVKTESICGKDAPERDARIEDGLLAWLVLMTGLFLQGAWRALP